MSERPADVVVVVVVVVVDLWWWWTLDLSCDICEN
jgi:hypothetical protein